MSGPRSSRSLGSVADYLLPVVLLLIAAAYGVMAQQFGTASRAVPQLVGAVTALLCVLDAVSRTDTAYGRAVMRWLNPAGAGDLAIAHRHRQALAVIGIVVLAVAMVLAGILPSVAVFGFLALRFRAGRGWVASSVAGTAIAAVIWGLFSLVLGLHLFPGLLFGGEW